MTSPITDPSLDPITFAVVKSALDSVVDDMAYTIMRTARSEIVRDVLDYSATLCNAKGELIAQAKTVALHLGAVPDAIARVLEEYRDGLAPGDVIVLNDPYSGGHAPAGRVHVPADFFASHELHGFAVVIIHHSDMGGRVPGSNASDSTEIFQEGLRIPPTKLFEAGRPNRTLFRLIAQNVRLPATVAGRPQRPGRCLPDGRARLSAPARALRRRRHDPLPGGADRLRRAPDPGRDRALARRHLPLRGLDRRRRLLRRADPDPGGDHRRGRSALRRLRRQCRAGAGRHQQHASFVKSATYLSVRCALDHDVPNNSGVFRCIEVRAPQGSILNAEPPAPVAARALTGYRVVDVMLGCLAQIVPDKVPAAGEGGNTVVCIGGYDQDRRPFVMVDMINGAWGGRPDKDGVEAITNPSQNMSNTPVEVLEARLPVRIEEYGLMPDSCGAGRFRGGLGLVRSYRLTRRRGGAPAALRPAPLPALWPRRRRGRGAEPERPQPRARGARPAEQGHHDDPRGRPRPPRPERRRRAWRSARARPRSRIAEDLADGKISRDYAEREHGAIVDPTTSAIDRAGSERRRRERRQSGGG